LAYCCSENELSLSNPHKNFTSPFLFVRVERERG
jgi:hypothetical protein